MNTITKLRYFIYSLIAVLFLQQFSVNAQTKDKQTHPKASIWLTTMDKTMLFKKQDTSLLFHTNKNVHPTIVLDETKKFQTMDGFGFCLTGGSATLINKMDSTERKALLVELFSTDENNIGTSYLRISIGASDLNDHVFTYDDLPNGQTDPDLKQFNLTEDEKDLIPILKEIVKINPDIKILGSPWTAPTWMKTNNDTKGGSLKHEYYPVYAQYFVKYLKRMKVEGIPIDAITIQNEPLHPGNNPSMFMPADEQTTFIKENLGPALKEAKLNTKIIVYDHNPNHIEYAISVLNDPKARQYADGSAFHLYEGKIESLTDVHNAHPDKNLYFTEEWVGAPGDFDKNLTWHMKNLIVGAPRNWCKNVIEWNLASDPNLDPHTDRGGCNMCLGALTIGNGVTRNVAYYIIAHASKFVRPNSIRIASNIPGNLQNVAYKTPTGGYVVIVQNDQQTPQTFNISFQGKQVTPTLNGGSVATYIW